MCLNQNSREFYWRSGLGISSIRLQYLHLFRLASLKHKTNQSTGGHESIFSTNKWKIQPEWKISAKIVSSNGGDILTTSTMADIVRILAAIVIIVIILFVLIFIFRCCKSILVLLLLNLDTFGRYTSILVLLLKMLV